MDKIKIDLIRGKLHSMRINHDDMKLKDEEERLKAYGYTDCINDLLIWLKELEKLDIKVIIIK